MQQRGGCDVIRGRENDKARRKRGSECGRVAAWQTERQRERKTAEQPGTVSQGLVLVGLLFLVFCLVQTSNVQVARGCRLEECVSERDLMGGLWTFANCS